MVNNKLVFSDMNNNKKCSENLSIWFKWIKYGLIFFISILFLLIFLIIGFMNIKPSILTKTTINTLQIDQIQINNENTKLIISLILGIEIPTLVISIIWVCLALKKRKALLNNSGNFKAKKNKTSHSKNKTHSTFNKKVAIKKAKKEAKKAEKIRLKKSLKNKKLKNKIAKKNAKIAAKNPKKMQTKPIIDHKLNIKQNVSKNNKPNKKLQKTKKVKIDKKETKKPAKIQLKQNNKQIKENKKLTKTKTKNVDNIESNKSKQKRISVKTINNKQTKAKNDSSIKEKNNLKQNKALIKVEKNKSKQVLSAQPTKIKDKSLTKNKSKNNKKLLKITLPIKAKNKAINHSLTSKSPKINKNQEVNKNVKFEINSKNDVKNINSKKTISENKQIKNTSLVSSTKLISQNITNVKPIDITFEKSNASTLNITSTQQESNHEMKQNKMRDQTESQNNPLLEANNSSSSFLNNQHSNVQPSNTWTYNNLSIHDITDDYIYYIIMAYGGSKNILNISYLLGKLKVQVYDQAKVNMDLLKQLGAKKPYTSYNGWVYAIFNKKAKIIKNKIDEILTKDKVNQ